MRQYIVVSTAFIFITPHIDDRSALCNQRQLCFECLTELGQTSASVACDLQLEATQEAELSSYALRHGLHSFNQYNSRTLLITLVKVLGPHLDKHGDFELHPTRHLWKAWSLLYNGRHCIAVNAFSNEGMALAIARDICIQCNFHLLLRVGSLNCYSAARGKHTLMKCHASLMVQRRNIWVKWLTWKYLPDCENDNSSINKVKFKLCCNRKEQSHSLMVNSLKVKWMGTLLCYWTSLDLAEEAAAALCWYFATEYHTPPAVFMAMPVKFMAPVLTPPKKRKPRAVAATPWTDATSCL